MSKLRTVRIWVDALPPSLNGSKGLMRLHHMALAREGERWDERIREAAEEVFDGPPIQRCRIRYTLHTSRAMDWDNAAASFKLVGDALVHCHILADDKPQVILEFVPMQVRCKRKEVGIEVWIEELGEHFTPWIQVEKDHGGDETEATP